MKILLLIPLILLSACSTKTPPNRWQYQSNNAYKNFERYYLENNPDMAALEFDRARSYASQSGDLTTLARIELSKCALKRALLEPFSCQEYEQLTAVIDDSQLHAYYALLAGTLSKEDIVSLPKQYQQLAALLSQNDSVAINQAIRKMEPLTSRMIGAAVAEKYLDEATIDTIIAEASYYGYKHALLVWMHLLAGRTKEDQKRIILQQKLKILTK